MSKSVFLEIVVHKRNFKIRFKEEEMNIKSINDKVREKFVAYNVKDAQSFRIIKCFYTCKNKHKYYDVPINSADAVKDMCEDPQIDTVYLNTEKKSLNPDVKQEEEKDSENKILKAIEASTKRKPNSNVVDKLAINKIPYKFDGETSPEQKEGYMSSIHHFKIKFRRVAKNQGWTTEFQFGVLTSGVLITGKAYEFIQQSAEQLNNVKKFADIIELNDSAIRKSTKLDVLWKLLQTEYYKMNMANTYYNKIRLVKQNNKSIQQYKKEFDAAVELFEIEVAAQAELKNNDVPSLTEVTKADLFKT